MTCNFNILSNTTLTSRNDNPMKLQVKKMILVLFFKLDSEKLR